MSMLKQEYKDTPTLKESLELAIKVLSKTLDSTKLSSNKGQSSLVAKLALPCHYSGDSYSHQDW